MGKEEEKGEGDKSLINEEKPTDLMILMSNLGLTGLI